jgi:hypothetical protein
MQRRIRISWSLCVTAALLAWGVRTLPVGAQTKDLRGILSAATKQLGWRCFVLSSPNQDLAVLGLPQIKCDRAAAAFPGPSGGRQLALADYRTAEAAARALAAWRAFRARQGGWQLSTMAASQIRGASEGLALVGGRGSGAMVLVTSGRHLVTACQFPQKGVRYDAAERNRLLQLATQYAAAVVKQLPSEAPLTQVPHEPKRVEPRPAVPKRTGAREGAQGGTPEEVTERQPAATALGRARERLSRAEEQRTVAEARLKAAQRSGDAERIAYARRLAEMWQKSVEASRESVSRLEQQQGGKP